MEFTLLSDSILANYSTKFLIILLTDEKTESRQWMRIAVVQNAMKYPTKVTLYNSETEVTPQHSNMLALTTHSFYAAWKQYDQTYHSAEFSTNSEFQYAIVCSFVAE